MLSNSDLQLNVLARQTEVTQQINSMRSQELALSQTRLANERARDRGRARRQTRRGASMSCSGRSPSAASSPAEQFADSRDDL